MTEEVLLLICGVAMFWYAAWRAHLYEKTHGRWDDDDDMGDP